MLCVRYTQLETLHAGLTPITRTEVSRIDDDETRVLIRGGVNRFYTFRLHTDDPKLQTQIERWMGIPMRWVEPEIDPRMISSSAKPL